MTSLTLWMMLTVSDRAVIVGRVIWDLLVCLVERAPGDPSEEMVTGVQRGKRATWD